MKQKISELLKTAVDSLKKESALTVEKIPDLTIEKPKEASFGDYSSNIAMLLARGERRPPIELAEAIANKINSLDRERTFERISAARPGFINFVLSRKALLENLKDIINLGERYGQCSEGRGKKVLVEFVSANPTGPLHVGHGRWAVIGDAIASLLSSAGYRVDREYYVNDVGRQVDLLRGSVLARAAGADVPEGGYGGEYVKDLAEKFKRKLNDRNLTGMLIRSILDEQKNVLLDLKVKFDNWFFESSLYKKKKVEESLGNLKAKGVTFKEGGALWFKSKELGDDKNRVLVREDGVPTYFASDIAYHIDKFKRKYDRLIDVWGTDHHGYVARLNAALKVLGYPAERLKIIIGQLVSLFRAGVPVRMSKRSGEMVTLREVVDEIGVDATRFFFLMLSPDSHLDFDLDLAKKHSSDNPVYYVQYAHARISSILREAEKIGFGANTAMKNSRIDLLGETEEFDLIKQLIAYPDELSEAAATLLPHKLINYARELSAIFHNFYHKYRVISDDRDLTRARLTLVFAARIVLKNVLKSLDISAPEQM